MHGQTSLAKAFLKSAGRNRSRPALWCRGRTLSYGELRDAAAAIAGTLICDPMVNRSDRIAVLSDRTSTAYVGILAALLTGAAYVPLNPRFPVQRNRAILERSGAETLICDERHRPSLQILLHGLPSPPRLVLPESDCAAPVDAHQLIRTDFQTNFPDDCLPESTESDLAYILFTSGSTGIPKGVPISNGNVLRYLQSATQLSGVITEDRNIQLVDLTFDLSVHDMFMTWLNGASLYSVPEKDALLATRFVEEHEITGWLSVPSTAGFLKQAGALIHGSMSSLRFTFFCGEALASTVAEAWAAAAPNSAIFNIYGPTEATVAFSAFRYESGRLPPLDVVPLGLPLPDQHMGLFTPEGARCQDELGEICLSGSQVMAGYWTAPEITATRFFEAEGRRWYRTGDLGRYEATLGYLYAGRADRQVKILGFRVELQEIEIVVRRATGSEMVAVLPWPKTTDGGAIGTVAFVMSSSKERKGIIEECVKSLPYYMVPHDIIFVDALPINSNGKMDYDGLEGHPALASRPSMEGKSSCVVSRRSRRETTLL